MRKEINEAIKRVLDSGKFILDKEVVAFEEEFAHYCGTEYAVGCGNGTEAIYLALKAIGIEQGDEVITVSHTAGATIAAIKMANAIPVYIDIDEDSYLMNAELIPRAITSRTKAIIPVHLYGRQCDMLNIMQKARAFGLCVIEDCCQSVGAGQLFGVLGCYSFYPTKNLGGIGDGGCVIGDFWVYANRVKLLRQYGWEDRFISNVNGINSRLDEIQAAVLRVKLKYLDKENKRRRELAQFYHNELNDDNDEILIIPEIVDDHVFHQFVVRATTDYRDLIVERLGLQIHYPVPCHQQSAFKVNITLPVTERICKEIFSMPMRVTTKEAKKICDKIKETIR